MAASGFDTWNVLIPLHKFDRFLSEFCRMHRLNMEVDLQILFGLYVTWCAQLYSLVETPQPPPPHPPAWALYEGAIGQQDRRHLLVTPWSHASKVGTFIYDISRVGS